MPPRCSASKTAVTYDVRCPLPVLNDEFGTAEDADERGQPDEEARFFKHLTHGRIGRDFSRLLSRHQAGAKRRPQSDAPAGRVRSDRVAQSN